MRSTWLPDRSFGFTLYHKVTDPYHRLSFKKNQMLFLPALLHDLLQQINVAGEGFAPLPRQRVGRERPAFLEGLGHRDVARLVQGAHVGGEVAVSHAQGRAHFGEGKLGRRGQERHDCEPPLLVNDPVELEKRFGIHSSFFPRSVK